MRNLEQLDAADVTLVIRVTAPRASRVANRVADALKAALGQAAVDAVDVSAVDVAIPTQRSGPAVRVFPDSRRVLHRGVPVELTRLEFDLLLHLCSQPRRVHRRAALMHQVWGATTVVDTRTVDVHVRRIRRKLGDAAGVIGTVRGVGYRMDQEHQVRVEREG
ncbi:winged helix-turn-helix domain-containing protein [Umezawaea sp. Da 62-37]|uniref:winged helix-turn-helix domain-containing protein n=1 Tax=Umezawaea sp. Da 62-37 TaxID=3075927 RepID=UPI0028F72A7A|nr:winged helix-turn-helix domain-containing protein [Umezawaea sp. Da 62-37]WNV89117.1 winged helix-turn-helix domain-containing protein [Umezawaea sp. Da 62-37]